MSPKRGKRNNPACLEWSLRLSRPGSLIIAGNVVRGGRGLGPGDCGPGRRGVRRFNEMIAADPHLAATAIQTAGAKAGTGSR
jgi:predicted O-methyltransferase YrrM